jgi:hypothetical protein
MPIPAFRLDGYLPVGLHPATETEVAERFGHATERRKALMTRVAEWLRLARSVRAVRFLVNGSFVTAKLEPGDVDCVCWLPTDFESQYGSANEDAMRLYHILVTRHPEELFGVFTAERWARWVAFFSQTRENDGRLKGLVEVLL